MTTASDTDIARAMLDLEHELACLHSMTRVMSEMMAIHLTDDDRQDKGRSHYQILLTDSQMDLLAFTWMDVTARAGRLEKAFYAATEGKILR